MDYSFSCADRVVTLEPIGWKYLVAVDHEDGRPALKVYPDIDTAYAAYLDAVALAIVSERARRRAEALPA